MDRAPLSYTSRIISTSSDEDHPLNLKVTNPFPNPNKVLVDLKVPNFNNTRLSAVAITLNNILPANACISHFISISVGKDDFKITYPHVGSTTKRGQPANISPKAAFTVLKWCSDLNIWRTYGAKTTKIGKNAGAVRAQKEYLQLLKQHGLDQDDLEEETSAMIRDGQKPPQVHDSVFRWVRIYLRFYREKQIQQLVLNQRELLLKEGALINTTYDHTPVSYKMADWITADNIVNLGFKNPATQLKEGETLFANTLVRLEGSLPAYTEAENLKVVEYVVNLIEQVQESTNDFDDDMTQIEEKLWRGEQRRKHLLSGILRIIAQNLKNKPLYLQGADEMLQQIGMYTQPAGSQDLNAWILSTQLGAPEAERPSSETNGNMLAAVFPPTHVQLNPLGPTASNFIEPARQFDALGPGEEVQEALGLHDHDVQEAQSHSNNSLTVPLHTDNISLQQQIDPPHTQRNLPNPPRMQHSGRTDGRTTTARSDPASTASRKRKRESPPISENETGGCADEGASENLVPPNSEVKDHQATGQQRNVREDFKILQALREQEVQKAGKMTANGKKR